MDANLDLFLPFHSLVHYAVSVVYECYQAMWIETADNNLYLYHWMSKKLTGSEMFQEVKDKLVPKVSNIGDYLLYIVCTPHMTVLLHIHHCEPLENTMVALLMSLDTFKKYNAKSCCHEEELVAKYSFFL